MREAICVLLSRGDDKRSLTLDAACSRNATRRLRVPPAMGGLARGMSLWPPMMDGRGLGSMPEGRPDMDIRGTSGESIPEGRPETDMRGEVGRESSLLAFLMRACLKSFPMWKRLASMTFLIPFVMEVRAGVAIPSLSATAAASSALVPPCATILTARSRQRR
jgi:hypothetical protein